MKKRDFSARYAQEAAIMREYAEARRAAGIALADAGPRREELAARLAEIPADTRSLTARIFGDPLPGRSALDRRQA